MQYLIRKIHASQGETRRYPNLNDYLQQNCEKSTNHLIVITSGTGCDGRRNQVQWVDFFLVRRSGVRW